MEVYLELRFSSSGSRTVEMNIERRSTFQNYKCCGAARPKMHDTGRR
jgi:hypothetical protein